jgi:hypothetical protein
MPPTIPISGIGPALAPPVLLAPLLADIEAGGVCSIASIFCPSESIDNRTCPSRSGPNPTAV